MVLKASTSFSGTPELLAINLNLGSWHTHLGFGCHVPVFCTDLNLYNSFDLVRLPVSSAGMDCDALHETSNNWLGHETVAVLLPGFAIKW